MTAIVNTYSDRDFQNIPSLVKIGAYFAIGLFIAETASVFATTYSYRDFLLYTYSVLHVDFYEADYNLRIRYIRSYSRSPYTDNTFISMTFQMFLIGCLYVYLSIGKLVVIQSNHTVIRMIGILRISSLYALSIILYKETLALLFAFSGLEELLNIAFDFLSLGGMEYLEEQRQEFLRNNL